MHILDDDDDDDLVKEDSAKNTVIHFKLRCSCTILDLGILTGLFYNGHLYIFPVGILMVY